MNKIVLTAGLALFSMFFGSGNLVYPLSLGAQTQDQFWHAALGLSITAVLVPFLGVLSILLMKGDRHQYFGQLGKKAPFILTALTLSLLGPFGIVPRCVVVAQAGVTLLYPPLSPVLFNALFCSTLFMIILRKDQVMTILGRILSPLLVAGLIIVLAVFLTPTSFLPIKGSEPNAFIKGLSDGYQTMDLLAGFFFASPVLLYLKERVPQEKPLLLSAFKACLIGGLLLSLTYLAFVYMGAKYGPVLSTVPQEQMLAHISSSVLGQQAQIITTLTILLACLTTAIILADLFTRFLQESFPYQGWVHKHYAALTILMSYGLSLLGFSLIAQVLGQVLSVLYPALIALAVGTLINHAFGSKRWFSLIFWPSLGGTILKFLLG